MPKLKCTGDVLFILSRNSVATKGRTWIEDVQIEVVGVAGNWRKLRSDDLRSLYSSTDIGLSAY